MFTILALSYYGTIARRVPDGPNKGQMGEEKKEGMEDEEENEEGG